MFGVALGAYDWLWTMKSSIPLQTHTVTAAEIECCTTQWNDTAQKHFFRKFQ